VNPSRSRAIAGATTLTLALAGCVPEGPASREEPAPSKPPQAKPSAPAMVFRDDFERAELGSEWRPLSEAWRIARGELCVAGAHNQGVWLTRKIPMNARIAFDARADSADGDIKAELWGDGKSGASSASYDDATGYLVIFGGWRNSRHMLARLDEHGAGPTLTVDPSAEDRRKHPVVPGQRYRFLIERRDGKTVRWWIDDRLVLELADRQPLVGAGHEHFGFNDWTAAVCFDNLEISPL
jgi:hypothetical protein